MNKKIQTKFGPYPFLTVLLCAISCTLRTVATFLGVDSYGYFENATLFRVSVWVTVATVAILLTLPLAYRKRQDALVEQTTPHTFLPSMMLGMLFLFFVGEGVHSLLSDVFLPTIDKLAFVLSLVLSLVSCIYFFSLAILESTINDRKANLGMACVLFFGIYSAYLYLDITTARNAHLEVSEEMTFIALSLYFLYEVRISIGKQKQNLYVMFAMIAGTLTAFQTIPTLIYYLVTGTLLQSSLTVFLLSLGILVFIISRLIIFEKSPIDAPISLVERLVRLAKTRENEVSAIEAHYAPKAPVCEEASVEDEATALDEGQPEEVVATADADEESTESLVFPEDASMAQEVQEAEEATYEEVSDENMEFTSEAPVIESTPDEAEQLPTAAPVTDIEDESEREFILPTENVTNESEVAPQKTEATVQDGESNEPKEE